MRVANEKRRSELNLYSNSVNSVARDNREQKKNNIAKHKMLS
jgi:hypothetical protein